MKNILLLVASMPLYLWAMGMGEDNRELGPINEDDALNYAITAGNPSEFNLRLQKFPATSFTEKIINDIEKKIKAEHIQETSPRSMYKVPEWYPVSAAFKIGIFAFVCGCTLKFAEHFYSFQSSLDKYVPLTFGIAFFGIVPSVSMTVYEVADEKRFDIQVASYASRENLLAAIQKYKQQK